MAIIFGTLVELGKVLEWPTFKIKGEVAWGIKSTTENLRLKACKVLYKEYCILAEKYPTIVKDSKQKLEIICPILQEHYNVNIVVHQIVTKDVIVYSSPKVYEAWRPRIDIFQEIEGEIGHVGVISYINSKYIENHGWTCVICKRNTTGHSNRHRCENVSMPSCQNCKRILSKNALCYKGSRDLFCRGSHENKPVNCQKCGLQCSNSK